MINFSVKVALNLLLKCKQVVLRMKYEDRMQNTVKVLLGIPENKKFFNFRPKIISYEMSFLERVSGWFLMYGETCRARNFLKAWSFDFFNTSNWVQYSLFKGTRYCVHFQTMFFILEISAFRSIE